MRTAADTSSCRNTSQLRLKLFSPDSGLLSIPIPLHINHGRHRTATKVRFSLLTVRFPPPPHLQINKSRATSFPAERTNSEYREISIPLPTQRLASSALQTLDVDPELSAFVRRTLTLTTPAPEMATEPQEKKQKQDPSLDDSDESKTVLQVNYYATTNRMLRVAVNGFMESMGVILGAMAELDVDVLEAEFEG